MARDVSDDNPLTPEEALDSDEVRNDDGDEVVDPPEEWIDAAENETLDERLAEEEPDVTPDDVDPRDADASPPPVVRDRGQVDGTPEDGDSFYDVVEGERE